MEGGGQKTEVEALFDNEGQKGHHRGWLMSAVKLGHVLSLYECVRYDKREGKK